MIPLKDDNPTTRAPYVTLGLIALNSLIFLWQFSLGAQAELRVSYGLGLVPSVLLGERELSQSLAILPAALTPLTSMFLHGGWMHLIGNMLFLWIFGNNIEDAMGHVRFVAFYLLCGFAAAAAQVAQDIHSTVPMIGASGAIAGVLGAYILLYPRTKVLVLLPIIIIWTVVRLPAWVLIGFWFGMQFLLGAGSLGAGGGGVAHWAHVGGFVAGLGLVLLFKEAHVPLFGGPAAPPTIRLARPIKTKVVWRGGDDQDKPGPWG